jgi:hypothetical protein
MQTNNKNSVNPVNVKLAREHRPLRFIVRQFFNEKDEETGEVYRHEVFTSYHSKLEQIPKMASIYAQAINNINRFGGELYADYGDGPFAVQIR